MLISLSIILSSVTDIYEIFVQDNYDFYILKLLNSFSVGGAMTPPPPTTESSALHGPAWGLLTPVRNGFAPLEFSVKLCLWTRDRGSIKEMRCTVDLYCI